MNPTYAIEDDLKVLDDLRSALRTARRKVDAAAEAGFGDALRRVLAVGGSRPTWVGDLDDGAAEEAPAVDGHAVAAPLPLNGTALPANGAAPRLDGKAAPVNGNAAPVNGKAAPVNGKAVPVNGVGVPAKGAALPANGTALPVRVAEVPVNGKAMPVNGAARPTNRVPLPVNVAASQANGAALPANGAVLPAKSAAVPVNRAPMPTNGAALPVNRVPQPPNGAALPVQRMEPPEKQVTLPVNGGALPRRLPDAPPAVGRFTAHAYSNGVGRRDYKLYVPAVALDEAALPLPLVVMLHGCSQSPDDFAAGTRMNALAERHGFYVIYPAQACAANGQKCWNWFRSENQARDAGEPALIAGITREVVAQHRVDSARVFVAGLSAGGAMAVILGETYPDLYAAVGAHSALPYAAAYDFASAFAAMKGATGLGGLPGVSEMPPPDRSARRNGTLPTIVFHGDRDHTVDVRNGAEIVEQATLGIELRTLVEHGGAGERRYTRTVHVDEANRPLVEHWVVQGGGHAWSGGNSVGSFTDASGPDASAEMVRFFFSQPRPRG